MNNRNAEREDAELLGLVPKDMEPFTRIEIVFIVLTILAAVLIGSIVFGYFFG